jgi:D-arabinose 1-dehydrogenase-like Zn-dependent alcohol dehydrogenase
MPTTMRAARFSASDRRLELTEVPVPQPGPLEVLIKVDACGICLSDVHLIDGSIPPVTDVVTLGHEASGAIVAVGELVPSWTEGDRVTMMGGRPCTQCVRCRSGRFEGCMSPELMGFHYDGAWAEYVVVPFHTLAALPDGIVPEQAAILADAVATPYSAITERGGLRPGESVGLWGIGGLGTHAVQIARLAGASLVVAVDPLPGARDRALKVGADVALDPTAVDVRTKVFELTGGVGLDLALDLVGANAVLNEAVSCLGRGGRAVMVGLSVEPLVLEPSILFGVQSHAVLGHLGYSKAALDDLVRLLASGRLDLSLSISDVIPLADIHEGVRRLAEKDGDPVRIVVRP